MIIYYMMLRTERSFCHEGDMGGVKTHFWGNFDSGSDTLPDGLQTVVFGNGAFASARSLRPFVEEFLDEASLAGQPVIAVTYEDPCKKGAYKPPERVVTLGKTVLGAADLWGPVHLVGHSWSSPHAANVAAAFPEAVKSLNLYTPIGYSGTQTPHKPLEFFAACIREGLSGRESSFSGMRTSAILALSAFRRFVRAPIVGIKATRQALHTDQVEVSTFHRERSGVDHKLAVLEQIERRAVVAVGDVLFPADPAICNLQDHGFVVSKISGTHPEAITCPGKARELYRIMFEANA